MSRSDVCKSKYHSAFNDIIFWENPTKTSISIIWIDRISSQDPMCNHSHFGSSNLTQSNLGASQSTIQARGLSSFHLLATSFCAGHWEYIKHMSTSEWTNVIFFPLIHLVLAMKFSAKVVMITTLSITMATPVKQDDNPPLPPLPVCLIWIGNAPHCNVSPKDCPKGFKYSGISSLDADGSQEPCSEGIKYLCINGNILFPSSQF